MTDHRYFPAGFLSGNENELASTVRPLLRRWGAIGYRIVGNDPKLRLEIIVPKTVQRPRNPVLELVIAGRRIKPTVHARPLERKRAIRTSGESDTAIGLCHAVAPGARVRVGRDDIQEFVGIACVVRHNGDLSLLTCGHAEAFSSSDEILAGDEPDGVALATLKRNFLEDRDPLDAALCLLTDEGRGLLGASSGASTWRFDAVHTPSVDDNGRRAVFWQTHDGEDDAQTARIQSFSATTSSLFGARGPDSSFIESSHAITPGDSGAPLTLGDSLYGLCSGFISTTAFFTPIAAVLERLGNEGDTCDIFTPRA